ncbi:MAG TPA: hypothetical protein VMW31_05330 [Devosiaceae bacterium]|nr:hypothetical protein [Devosiaceae bacterium]
MDTAKAKPELVAAALRAIETMQDAKALRAYMVNAKRLGADEVYQAAFRKLMSILPEEKPGSIEHDFWSTIHAFEQTLTEERGKTTRLTRTRQKVQRVGVKETPIGFATNATSIQGFDMLIERGFPELTGEAIVLKHRGQFSDEVVEAARNRLRRVGVDVSTLT